MSVQGKTQTAPRAPAPRAMPKGVAPKASQASVTLDALQRKADDSAQTQKLATLQTKAASTGHTLAPVQRRQHGDLGLKDFLTQHPKPAEKDLGAHVKDVTVEFKKDFPQHDRADINFLRTLAWGAKNKGTAPFPKAINIDLAANFDAHVKGEEPGKGWHTEKYHARNGGTYDYANKTLLASSKNTSFADNVKIAGTAKSGNGGRTTFFPPDMSIESIRKEALYVANTYPKVQSVATGLSQKKGVLMDTLISDGTVESAYPHKDGW